MVRQHPYKNDSPEYHRMHYICKKNKISFAEYMNNREKYDVYDNGRKKHLHLELYSSEYYKTILLKKAYNITLEQYNEMLLAQGGVCLICGKGETTRHRKTGEINGLSVDHDHTTGQVRGLLCNACNRGLGYFRDNPDLLAKAKDYLDKS